MRFLSHILALVAAVHLAAAPAILPATPLELAPITHANTAEHLAGAQPDAQPRDLDEDDPAWQCWVDGNRVCTDVPLDGPGDGPAVGTSSTSPQVTGVPPVCSTDAECEAYDLARGIVAWT